MKLKFTEATGLRLVYLNLVSPGLLVRRLLHLSEGMHGEIFAAVPRITPTIRVYQLAQVITDISVL